MTISEGFKVHGVKYAIACGFMKLDNEKVLWKWIKKLVEACSDYVYKVDFPEKDAEDEVSQIPVEDDNDCYGYHVSDPEPDAWFIPQKEPARTLPEGWYWEHFKDGSGSLYSPKREHYISYDLGTGEIIPRVDTSITIDFWSGYPEHISLEEAIGEGEEMAKKILDNPPEEIPEDATCGNCRRGNPINSFVYCCPGDTFENPMCKGCRKWRRKSE